MKLSGRQLWIAFIIAFEVVAFWYFICHAPMNEGHTQDPRMRAQSSSVNRIRKCLPESNRDPRYVRPEVCVTQPQRLQILEDLIFELSVILENTVSDYWIDSGTLLGQYRGKSIIPWDFNGDVGILEHGLRELRTKPAKIPTGYAMNVLDSALYERGDCSYAIPARFIDTKFGFYVNIYVFLEEIDPNGEDEETMVRMLGPISSLSWSRCVRCRNNAADDEAGGDKDSPVVDPLRFLIPYDWVFPLRMCLLETFHVRCPAQPVPYLMHLYGDTFLSPTMW